MSRARPSAIMAGTAVWPLLAVLSFVASSSRAAARDRQGASCQASGSIRCGRSFAWRQDEPDADLGLAGLSSLDLIWGLGGS